MPDGHIGTRTGGFGILRPMPDELPPGLERFLDWLPTAEPLGAVEPMLLQYRAWLEAEGASEEASGTAVAEVMRFMHERREAWAPLFDRIYRSPQPGFRTEPNALLVEAASSHAPGRALDVCTGQGRNALWLASQGWEVSGFDVSPEGIASARRQADAEGLSARFVAASADDFDYAARPWDLVAVLYAPVPVADPTYAGMLAGVLAPGGLLVVESFASDADAPRRRPVDIDPPALRSAVAGLEILRLDDVVDRPDWLDRPECLVRMVARKPLPASG